VSATPTEVYRAFLDAVNRQDLDAAQGCVDVLRYRENCVGFTPGFVDWDAARDAIRAVWVGLPDLHVALRTVAGDGGAVVAHGTVTGTNTGRLYGVPATRRRYEASFFDWVAVEDGLIVERVQQADVLGQMRQIYGKAFGVVGLAALLFRLP
jgi:predicted ester cyclase